MPEAVLLIGRGLQFASAMILFGAPLFGLYALGGERLGARLIRAMVLAATVVGFSSAVLVLMGQAASMSGVTGDLLRPSAWAEVLAATQFGRAWVLRLGLLAGMGVAASRRSSLWTYQPMAGLGTLLAVSLVWMGHGAADDGAAGLVHQIADMIHLLAAGAWLGALAPLLILVVWASLSHVAEVAATARRGLERFSGMGTAAVAVLVASGLVNGWFLIGRAFPGGLIATTYGLVLSAKLALFVVMLGLAALHRWRGTPRLARALDLGESPARALRRLGLGLVLETLLAIGVLTLVAWLGLLQPPIVGD
ncbi:MAG TPA: copper homeostasis membrane protein CopD [Caulobacteraceae bacterium]